MEKNNYKVAVFSTKLYDKAFLNEAKDERIELIYFNERLNPQTIALAKDIEAVCIFVNDIANQDVLKSLYQGGTRTILLRCAGFDNVDLKAAKELGMKVYRVPAYSPYAVAEMAAGILLCLNRKIHKAYNRVREMNFSLEGLIGFDLNGKTVGILGTGKIGQIMTKIMYGFGCKLIGYDIYPVEDLTKSFGLKYVTMNELLAQSDIISIHVPLMKETEHLINADSISKMKDGVLLINTSRGGLVDTKAVIQALKSGKIGGLGIDVYEQEADLFFEDLSGKILQDDTLSRLMTFPNVIVTGHQAFFTKEAQRTIAQVTVQNLKDFENKKDSPNELTKTIN